MLPKAVPFLDSRSRWKLASEGCYVKFSVTSIPTMQTSSENELVLENC